MKVSTSKVTKMVISDVPGLDPIAVIIENTGPGAGKITITCWGEAWTHYWSHMGEGNTLEQFFGHCDEHYIAGKLKTGIEDEIDDDDEDALLLILKKEIIKDRREGDITKLQARNLWELAGRTETTDADNLCSILGDEWWERTPKKPNPDYGYLCKIILAVQVAFRSEATA